MHKIVLFTTFFFTALSSFARQSSTCAFIENKGQIIDQNNQPNPSVRYLWNGSGLKVQLKENAFSYELMRSEKFPSRKPLPVSMMKDKRYQGLHDSLVWHSHRVDVSLVNANPHPELVAEQVQPEVLNYYTTGTPEEGVANVHQYGKVTYKEIYPNIDLEFISSDDATHPFKYNFIVHSGGEVKDIRLHYEGATATTLRYGNITIGTANGDLKEAIPTSYVMENGKDVTVQYLSIGNDTYGFQAERYPAHQTLVIDPWATYFGLPTNSTPGGLSVDRESNIVTVGLTTQSTNVATTGSHQTSYGGNSDAYVRKWSPSGFPIWCTYYGGSGQDGGGIPGHDSLGNIYFIGGTQSSSGIATPGSFIDTYSPSAGTNTFVAKLNTNGIRIWASYLNFEIYTMKIDHAANIIISGFAQVNGLATTGAQQTNLAGGTDDFLMKLNSNGIRLWATYYGGSDEELKSASIDVDNNNNIYLCGLTQSSNNIATPGSFQTVY